MELLKTLHGSRLYGLSTPESDFDWFTVVSKVRTNRRKYAKQTLKGSQDNNVVDLSTFMLGCEKGVPQYLEAMFSPLDTVNGLPFRSSYRAGTEALNTYLRTMKSFCMADTYKTRRHAVRLAFNLRDLARYGRFNPVLTSEQRHYANLYGHCYAEPLYDYLRKFAGF